MVEVEDYIDNILDDSDIEEDSDNMVEVEDYIYYLVDDREDSDNMVEIEDYINLYKMIVI